MNKYSTFNEINNLIYEGKEFKLFVENLNQISLLCNDYIDKSKVMKLFETYRYNIKKFIKH